MEINTYEQLNTLVQQKIIKKLLEFLRDKAVQIIKKSIDKNTYGTRHNYYYENGGTEPTYEFRDEAWNSEFEYDKGGDISGMRIFYDYEKLTPPSVSRPFTHGSYNYSGDFRKQLPYVLNIHFDEIDKNGMPQKLGMFFGKAREPFWDLAMQEFEGNFERYVKEFFSKTK